MGEKVTAGGFASSAEFARRLADEVAGLAGDGRPVDAWLLDQLEPLLRQRLAGGTRLAMADTGKLVQQLWDRWRHDGEAPEPRGRRGKASKGGDKSPSGATHGAGTSTGSAEAERGPEPGRLHLTYTERAAAVVRRLVRDVIAREEGDADPATAGVSPAARTLQALEALAAFDPPLARTVSLHWFGGLEVDAVAGLLGGDAIEVRRAWQRARAFLAAAAKGAGAARRGKGHANPARPLPDASTWPRVSNLFDTGTALPDAAREGWLASLGGTELAIVLDWLRAMLAAAAAAESDKAVERGPRLPHAPGVAAVPSDAADTGTHLPADLAAPGGEQVDISDGGSSGVGSGKQGEVGHGAADSDHRKPAPPTTSAPGGGSAPAPLADAPALHTGMRLGPWTLLGPMNSSDSRVTQWRAKRIDEDASGAEFGLLIPRRWRTHRDIAALLAQAAAGPLSLVHPHIARLVAAGVADDGTPWIATELAEGQPIDRWCRDHSLDLDHRRLLMQQALEAVVFAHDRMVLHGRIHPTCIIVTPEGRLRWLNFGLTGLLSVLGVPAAPSEPTAGGPPPSAYLAPELLPRAGGHGPNAEPVGTAPTATAEVHALGLILFEVVAGASPWQPPEPGKSSPVAPGTHWRRPSDLASALRLRRALAGRFDAVVAKATQIDPARRYAGAAPLLDDLRRAGEHRPVAAMDSGFAFEVTGLARRHRTLTTATVALLAAGFLSLGGLTWMSFKWTRDLADARAAWQSSEAVVRLMQGLLHESAPRGIDVDEKQLLTHAETVARTSLKEPPAHLGHALALIGRQQGERGDFVAARKLQTEALTLLAGRPPSIETSCDEAWARGRQGDDSALGRLRHVGQSAVAPSARAYCLARQADLERRAGRVREAYQTTLAARTQWDLSTDRPPQTAVLLGRPMGALSAALGRMLEAQQWFEWTMKHVQALHQDSGPVGIELRERWSEALLSVGDAQGAMKMADFNLTVLVGKDSALGIDTALAPPASLYYAAAEPRVELHLLADARSWLDRGIL